MGSFFKNKFFATLNPYHFIWNDQYSQSVLQIVFSAVEIATETMKKEYKLNKIIDNLIDKNWHGDMLFDYSDA